MTVYHDRSQNTSLKIHKDTPYKAEKTRASSRRAKSHSGGDLNKAGPQTAIHSLEIDLESESLSDTPFKCFWTNTRVIQGYHQIQKDKDDEEKTAVQHKSSVNCYNKDAFWPKKAGANYSDWALRKINMKLNPKKMHFWGYKANVPLGYLIETCRASSRGPERQKLSSNFLHPHDERSPVVKWEVSRFEQVPIQVSRQVTPLVQNTQEVYEEGRLPLDYSSRRSFHAAQAAYSSTSHASPLHPTREEFIMYLSSTQWAISAVLTDR
ncbi:hypothetical protein Tco_0546659 [Tanacetum coccineum]